jgi:zinc/manganese transport system ATP-binding protein
MLMNISHGHAAITARNLTLAYERHPAVHHISGEFITGKSAAIIGPNGAGKSTFLKAMVGLVQVQHGELRIASAQQPAYLPQMANIDRSFPISVRDAVLLGLWRKSGWFGGAKTHDYSRAEAALARVGLAGFGSRLVSQLSSGQFQRVLFARIVLEDAPLILLDEPFTAIDARTTADLLRLIAEWRAEGRTVIAVLHDYAQVAKHFDDTLLLAREMVAWGATSQVLTEENLQRANAMAETWQDNAPVCHRDEEIES